MNWQQLKQVFVYFHVVWPQVCRIIAAGRLRREVFGMTLMLINPANAQAPSMVRVAGLFAAPSMPLIVAITAVIVGMSKAFCEGLS